MCMCVGLCLQCFVSPFCCNVTDLAPSYCVLLPFWGDVGVGGVVGGYNIK